MIETPLAQEGGGLHRHNVGKQHPGMTHRQHDVIARAGQTRLIDGHRAVVGFGQIGSHQSTQTQGVAASDNADFARREIARRFTRIPLGEATADGHAAELML